jgi:hypothetical protein
MMEKNDVPHCEKSVVLSISNRLYIIKIEEDPHAHDIDSILRNG